MNHLGKDRPVRIVGSGKFFQKNVYRKYQLLVWVLGLSILVLLFLFSLNRITLTLAYSLSKVLHEESYCFKCLTLNLLNGFTLDE